MWEILTKVAIQDLLAQDAESYDLPTNIPTFTSVSDSWDSFDFDFVNPFARDDSSDSDSDWEAGEEETTNDTLQSPPKPIDSPNQFRRLDRAPLPSVVHIDREIQYISPFEVEVAFGNSRPDSLPVEDYGDGEEAVITTPATPFPHPHLLSPIIEEDEDETSDTETIRPSTVSGHRNRLGRGDAKYNDILCEFNSRAQSDHRKFNVRTLSQFA